MLMMSPTVLKVRLITYTPTSILSYIIGELVYPPKLTNKEGAGCRVKRLSDTQMKLPLNCPCLCF